MGTQSVCQIELRPNCSLSLRAALLFFGSLCALSLAIAALFALQGFWPVLPFAGLEMLTLGWALAHSMRRQRQLQKVEVSGSEIVIESQDRHGGQRLVFPRHWAKVTLRAPRSALHPSRLLIESHGRSCEIGGFLTEGERRALAARLRQLIGTVNESPPFEARV